MAEAGAQLSQLNGHAVPEELTERFLGWARPLTGSARGQLPSACTFAIVSWTCWLAGPAPWAA